MCYVYIQMQTMVATVQKGQSEWVIFLSIDKSILQKGLHICSKWL